MKKILVIGNSSSGKSTLAKSKCLEYKLAHLDLDTIAWLPLDKPQRKPLSDSLNEILTFIQENEEWVIEGCYTDLIEGISNYSNELIYMNTSVEACVENAKNRPWEPHKYDSLDEQNNNLSMLIEWIKQYDKRKDEISKSAHIQFFNNYKGKKSLVTSQS